MNVIGFERLFHFATLRPLAYVGLLLFSGCAYDWGITPIAMGLSGSSSSTLKASPSSIYLLNSESKTIFPEGGVPPYSYSILGAGQILPDVNELGEFFAVYKPASSDVTDTITITDAVQAKVSVPVVLHANPYLYLGHSWTTSTLFRVGYNTGTNAFTGRISANLPAAYTALRTLAPTADGSVFVGDAGQTEIKLFDKDLNAAAASLQLSVGSTGLAGVHGLCGLPNGNVIAGTGIGLSANPIVEFDPLGNIVRGVTTSQTPLVPANHPAVTSCFALSNRQILLIETDTYGVTSGNLTKMNLVNNSWVMAQRFSFAEFDVLRATAGSAPWSFLVHTNGYVYIPPINPGVGKTVKMVRCPLNNLTAATCSPIGTNLPTGNFIYGIAQIPGSDDMLITTMYRLYRMNFVSGVFTDLGAYSTGVSGTYLGGTSYIRSILFQ